MCIDNEGSKQIHYTMEMGSGADLKVVAVVVGILSTNTCTTPTLTPTIIEPVKGRTDDRRRQAITGVHVANLNFVALDVVGRSSSCRSRVDVLLVLVSSRKW